MSIKVNLLPPNRISAQPRATARVVTAEKRALLDRLQGRRLNTLEAVAEAEKAFAQMRDRDQIRTADFPLIRQLISEPPEDRWAEYYWSTEGMSGYDGPFGSVIFTFDGWRFDQKRAAIEEREREADAPVIRRREELIGRIKTYLLHNLPEEAPFLPDRYEPLWPLSLTGYQTKSLAEVKDYGDVSQVLAAIKRNSDLVDWWLKQAADDPSGPGCDFDYVLRPGSPLERELVLLSHQFGLFGKPANQILTPQQLLTEMRARIALARLKDKNQPSYHDLALLYYTLCYGASTLGSSHNSQTLAEALRSVKVRGIYCPRILVLGFSTIYSLENLAAILFLVGFKEAAVTALDLAEAPLALGHKYFGEALWSYPIQYVKGDARAIPFIAGSFDLVLTHLLLTHIRDQDKRTVLKEAANLLAEDGEFVDEEIVVSSNTDLNRYRLAYRILANEYPGTEEEKALAAGYLEKFGSHSVFHPYRSQASLAEDFGPSGLKLALSVSAPRTMYENEVAWSYQIRARK